jgi:peroxiredoxin
MFVGSTPSNDRRLRRIRRRARLRANSLHRIAYASPIVFDIEGQAIRLSSLWQQQRAVVVFFRHFGCRFCWRLAAEVAKIAPRLAAAESPIALIGVSLGTSAQAKRFVEESKFPGDLFVDPSSRLDVATLARDAPSDASIPVPEVQPQSYHAFGLQHGKQAFTEKTFAIGQSVLDQGFEDHPFFDDVDFKFSGDIYQNGGVFVMGPGQQCEYAYRSTFVGDDPDLDTVLEFATGVAATGEEHVYASSKQWTNKLRMFERVSSGDETSSNLDEKHTVSSTPQHLPDSHPDIKTHPGASIAQCPVFQPMRPKSTESTQRQQSQGLNSNAKVTTKKVEDSSSKWLQTFGALTLLVVLANILVCPFVPLSLFATVSYSVQLREFVWRLTNTAVTVLLSWFGSTFITRFSVGQRHKLLVATDSESAQDKVQEKFEDFHLRLYTPSEIDAAVMAVGGVDCDCDALIGGIPMNMLDTTSESSESDSVCDFSDNSDEDVLQQALQGCHVKSSISVEDASEEFYKTLCYVRQFLSKPHPNLGRKGPVCPFVPTSLRKQTIHLAVIRGDVHVPSVVRMAMQKFCQLVADIKSKRDRMYTCILLVFPDVSLEDAPRLIDGVQRLLKPEFVKRGLMLGEFHMRNNVSGLRNKSFYPLRTPIPLLAMRHMVPTDIAFLDIEQYDVPTRISLLTSFLERIGTDGSSAGKKERKQAEESLASLKQLLESEG